MPDTKFRADLKNAFFRTTPMFSITNPVRPELEIPKRIAKRLEDRPKKITRPRLVLAIGTAFSVLLVGAVVALQYRSPGAQVVADATRVSPATTAQPTGQTAADPPKTGQDGPTGGQPQTPPTQGQQPPATRISGPLGLSTVLPPGWTVSGSTESAIEAYSLPRGQPTRSILRLGGVPATGQDLLAAKRAEEATFTAQPGYTRITLAAQTYQSHPAVLWEFETGNHGRRTRILFWQRNTTVYFISLSTPAAAWNNATDKTFADLKAATTVS